MKRTTRSCRLALKVPIYTFLFSLLQQFAADRNPYAPVIYKILVFSYIENFPDKLLREFLSHNLRKTLAKIPTLPVGTLVEPLAKQFGLVESDGELIAADVELLRAVVAHNRLSPQSGLLLFDTLSKLLLQSFPFAQALSAMILGVLRRNVETEVYCEYAVKFVSVCLAQIYKSFNEGGAMRLDRERQLGRLGKNEAEMDNDEIEKELKMKTHRAVLVNTARDILLLRQHMINDQLESRLLYSNREVKRLVGYHYKGIVTLLQIVSTGDAQLKIEEYDREMQAVEQMRESAVKRNNFIEKAQEKNKRDNDVNEFRKELLGVDEEPLPDRDPARPPQKKQSRLTAGTGSVNGFNTRNPLDFDDDNEAVSEDEFEEMKRKFGANIGLKERAKPQEPSQAEKRGEKAWEKDGADHRTRKYLEELKKKKEQRKLKSIEKEITQKIKEDKVEKQLAEDLQWRKKLNPLNDREMLLDHGLGEYYQRGLKAEPLAGFAPLDHNDGDEEAIEKESINALFFKFRSQLQFLFKKYANLIPDRASGSFELMGKRANSMSAPELFRLLADFFLADYIDKHEAVALMKLVNQKGENAQTPKYLDYDGFCRLLVNLAVLIHTRPPLSMDHLAHAVMFQSLLDLLDKARKMKGEDQPNFGTTRSAKYIQDKDMIELMNFRLAENPEYELPPVCLVDPELPQSAGEESRARVQAAGQPDDPDGLQALLRDPQRPDRRRLPVSAPHAEPPSSSRRPSSTGSLKQSRGKTSSRLTPKPSRPTKRTRRKRGPPRPLRPETGS